MSFLRPIPLLVLVLLCACTSPRKDKRSFCYWRTSLDLSAKDDSVMDLLKVSHLYVRFFDVDWNSYEKEALPVGTISSWWDGTIGGQDITPAIYITNTVMENASTEQLDEMAIRLRNRVQKLIDNFSAQYASKESWKYRNLSYRKNSNSDSIVRIADSVEKYQRNAFAQRFHEILIDCDWTEKTKSNYFHFLEELKNGTDSKYTYSATVRLWQYRERKKAGIPPCDRILLMCYNTQDPASYVIKNSIADPGLIESYLDAGPYPVKTDVALPIFSWSLLFHDTHFEGIISDITDTDCLMDTAAFLQVKPDVFMFRRDTVIGDHYVRSGDELRVEEVKKREMDKIISSVIRHVDLSSDSKITFFSWNNRYINSHGIGNLEEYYKSFDN